MKNFTIGISRPLKKELNQVGDELEDKLMLPAVSYDRVIKELLVHYRKDHPASEKTKAVNQPNKKPPKPESRSRRKSRPQPETSTKINERNLGMTRVEKLKQELEALEKEKQPERKKELA